MKKKWIIGILCVWVLAGLLCSGDNDNEVQPSVSPDYVLSARELDKAWDGNELAANRKYVGSTVEVYGEVIAIDLVVGYLWVQIGENGRRYARLNFGDNYSSQMENVVSGLKKGQSIRAIGIVGEHHLTAEIINPRIIEK